jgi:hypothetical protein
MKARFYEEGVRYGRRLARAIEQDGEPTVVGDCSLAALRILKETGKRALHPVEALAEAYGLDWGAAAPALDAEQPEDDEPESDEPNDDESDEDEGQDDTERRR